MKQPVLIAARTIAVTALINLVGISAPRSVDAGVVRQRPLALVKTAAEEPNFQVKFSEPLAVFVFVRNLSSKAPTNPFKSLFNSSKFNQEKYQILIADFDNLNIDYTYEYKEYPFKNVGSTEFLLKKNLINGPTISDFKSNSLGIIPNADLFKLIWILGEFTPVYRELVYEPNKEKFEKQLRDIQNVITSTNMASYFKMGLKFYNSSWDNSIPFEFVFYPLPNSRGWTATAFYNNAVSAIPTSLTDYNGLLSVMFHEIFHILYDEESSAFQKDMAQWRASNPSKSSHYAFALLNEALATALGNGYVSGKLNGKLNEGNWYRWKYINLMAKKIYPMVKEYLENGRSIDKAFLDNYVKLFDDNFAGWLLELDYIMFGSFVVSDNSQVFNILDQKFPFRPEAEYEEGISAISLERMAKTQSTKMVVISRDNKSKLQLIKQRFKELRSWKPDHKTDFTYSVFLQDKTYLIVINSVKKPAEKLIETLKLK